MKSKFLAGGLTLLTAFALMACGTNNPGNSSTGESQGTSQSQGSDSGVNQGGWSDTDAELMRTHLGGYVMPYMAINGATVTWYSDYECVSIESTSGTETDVTNYKDLLVNQNGFAIEQLYDEENQLYYWEGGKDLNETQQVVVDIYFAEGFICDAYLVEATQSENGVFAFANTDQVTSQSASSVIWTAGNATMEVQKNTSTVDVGNTDQAYLSDTNGALRIYSGQKIIFGATGGTITSISLTCGSATYATALAGGTWANGTAAANGTEVVVTVGNATQVTVVLAAQTRITAATVTIA